MSRDWYSSLDLVILMDKEIQITYYLKTMKEETINKMIVTI